MTKDEALKILKECREKGFKYTFYTLGDYHTALDMAIKALEQEPCEDAISRQVALKVIDGWYEHNRNAPNVEDLIILITYMNSINSQEPQAESED